MNRKLLSKFLIEIKIKKGESVPCVVETRQLDVYTVRIPGIAGADAQLGSNENDGEFVYISNNSRNVGSVWGLLQTNKELPIGALIEARFVGIDCNRALLCLEDNQPQA